MRDMVKMGLILLLITAVSGLVLGVTNSMTEGIILERAMAGDLASLQVLLGDADSFEPVTGEDVDAVSFVKEVFAGKQGNEVVGYAIKLATTGYAGPVEIMVGITTGARVTGVEILSHSETPGLGTRITEQEFRDQFVGLDASGDANVDVISGATVSSNAVINGVNVAISLFQDFLKN